MRMKWCVTVPLVYVTSNMFDFEPWMPLTDILSCTRALSLSRIIDAIVLVYVHLYALYISVCRRRTVGPLSGRLVGLGLSGTKKNTWRMF